jgi:hypothetical protein
VSWQEELRRLDEELAAGQISADDYRVRRDQVLSSAVSSPAPEAAPGQQPPPQEATQHVPRTPPPPQQGGTADADKTQIVPGDSDRTQAVGGWQTARPPDEWERTQVVPGVPPQTYAGGMQPRPAPGPGQGPFPPIGPPPSWQQPGGEEPGSPWSGVDFPPLASTSPDWIRQGPEVFEASDRSRTGRTLLIVLVVVLVAGLGVGAWFIFGRKQNEPAAQPTTTAPPAPTTTTTPKQPKDDLSVAELPGNARIHDRIKTFADFEKDELGKLLTAEETKAYQQATPGKCRLTTADLDGGTHAYILTTEASTADQAVALRNGLVELQTKYSMQPYSGQAYTGVKVTQFAKNGDIPATIRAHYVHKKTVVRIQIYGNDLDQIGVKFEDIIADQLKLLPADA